MVLMEDYTTEEVAYAIRKIRSILIFNGEVNSRLCPCCFKEMSYINCVHPQFSVCPKCSKLLSELDMEDVKKTVKEMNLKKENV